MLIKSETLKELLYEKFEKTFTVPDEDFDSLVNGNFEVIKQLCDSLQYADEAKNKLDIICENALSRLSGSMMLPQKTSNVSSRL